MQNTNRTVFLFLFLFLASAAWSQKKETYQLIREENGLAFHSKWVELKGAQAGQMALFIKVVNRNDRPVNYSLGVEVFVDNIMVEEAAEAEYCIRPKKTHQGKLNGIYFVTDKVKKEDLASSKTVVELSDLKVQLVDACPPKKKS